MTKMVKRSFVSKIRNRDSKGSRKAIEIPVEEREFFDVGDDVKVTLETI